jgi:streptogramin lyase
MSATAVTLQERTADQAGVDAVVYPRPDYDGKPWSQWGQGIALDDGRLISAIGDSVGADGNSFLYEYDPESRVLTQFADALTVADAGHQAGDWGYGKIHAQMVEGPCGDIYLSTYWGTRRGLEFTEDYQGDVLLRLDPEGRTVENLGVILPEHGVASLASWPEGGLLYAEAADPFGEKTGSFVVIDATTGELIFEDDDPTHGGYRSIAVDSQGRAYITWDDDGLARYDPATNTLETLDVSMPGSILRWATPPDDAGTIYAVSRDPAVFFSLDEQGEVSALVPARGYTTSMGISPDADTFYYVPDAHGGAWEQGTSLIAVDTATGEETVVVELNPLIEGQLGLRAGGTYNVVVDPSGERIYVGLNAGDPATRDTFGEVVLAIVTLP